MERGLQTFPRFLRDAREEQVVPHGPALEVTHLLLKVHDCFMLALGLVCDVFQIVSVLFEAVTCAVSTFTEKFYTVLHVTDSTV